MEILSKGNPKLQKAEKYGWINHGIHLAPHTLSGNNTCKHASKGCIASCLNLAGMGVYSAVQTARINKTKLFFENRELFFEQLHKEITSRVNSAKRNGIKVAFRLNLTSDIEWESIKVNGKTIIDMFPDVQFYDYTKNFPRMLRFLTDPTFPKNYHLTFSRSERNSHKADVVLACGGNVAVVFSDKLPKKYKGTHVVSGMEHDLRFLDGKGKIVGLIALGKAKKDTTGFVIRDHI